MKIIYFFGTDQTFTILVRHDYSSETFCDKPVTKTSLKCGSSIYCIVETISEYTYIYGSGSTSSTSSGSTNTPLYAYRNSIKTVVIEEGITTIGTNFFNELIKLTFVQLPKSLTTMKYAAFRACTSLETFTIPSTTTVIGNYILGLCTKLKEILVEEGNTIFKSIDGVLMEMTTDNNYVLLQYPPGKELTSYTIPQNVTELRTHCFFGTVNLKEIIIPSSVTLIESNPFIECVSLEMIYVDSSNTLLSSVDGVLFNKTLSKIIAYPIGNKTSSYIIPSSVKIIGIYAFRQLIHLKTIVVPDSVKTLQTGCFQRINKMITILFGGTTLPSVCGNDIYLLSNSLNIKISNTLENGTKICNYNTENSLIVQTLGTSVKSIIDESSSYIYGEGEINKYGWITSPLYSYRNVISTVQIGEGITKIGAYLFQGLEKVQSFNIPNSVTTIENFAFRDCTSLKSIQFGKNIKVIGYNPFIQCSSLITVNIHPQNTFIDFKDNIIYMTSNMRLNTYLFANINSTSYTIPSYIKEIGTYSFMYNKLSAIHIHENVQTIGSNPFGYSLQLSTITIDDTNKNYTIKDGVLFTKDMKKLITFPGCLNKTSYSVLFGVETIGDNAFNNAIYIQTLLIPNSVKTFDSKPFRFMSSLTKMIISGSVQTINSNKQFGETKLLTSIIYDGLYEPTKCFSSMFLSSKITTIKVSTLYKGSETSFCGNKITISKELDVGIVDGDINYIIESDGTLTVYGNGKMSDYSANSPFYKNNQIINVEIHEGITNIGNELFMDCKSIKSITIPSSVEAIGYNPFCGCTKLTNLTLNNNQYFIVDDGVLFDKNKTKIIAYLVSNPRTQYQIPESVKVIEMYAFRDSLLTSIHIENNIERLGSFAFASSIQLTSVYIGKNLKIMNSNPFRRCLGLKNITIHEENNCFKIVDDILMDTNETKIINYSPLKQETSYRIPNTVTSIDYFSFAHQSYLESVTIPSSVQSIQYMAFGYSPNLKTIVFEGTQEPYTCRDNAFHETSSDLTIQVPSNYESNKLCGKTVIKSSS